MKRRSFLGSALAPLVIPPSLHLMVIISACSAVWKWCSELVRTGMGALEGNNTWQLFKYGYGPYVDGMFSQSNFGVVTKMGIWLMPEPPGYRPYMISFQREEDIEQVIEILRPLKVGMVIQNAATVRSLVLDAAIHETKSKYY